MKRPGNDVLIRYFRGMCSGEEEKIIALYLALGKDTEYISDCLQEAANLENGIAPVADQEELDNVWSKFLTRKEQTHSPTVPLHRQRWFSYAVAVMIVFMLCIPAFYLLNNSGTTHSVNWQQFSARTGQIRQLQLPDSSTITLFAGAVIEVPDNFGDTARNIRLTGRAFFDITPHPDKPFTVTSQGITTRVLGTRFEINTSEAAMPIITLHSGKVSVRQEDRVLAILLPDQQIRIDKATGHYEINRVEAAYTLSWMKGELDYEQAPLYIILRDLENWYGVTFSVPSALLNRKVTISFNAISIDSALTMLSRSAGFNYAWQENHLITIKERRAME